MKLDRGLQQKILEDLAIAYPENILDSAGLERWHDDEDVVIANLAYLHAHGLIDFGHDRSLSGAWLVHSVTATARGMDLWQTTEGWAPFLALSPSGCTTTQSRN